MKKLFYISMILIICAFTLASCSPCLHDDPSAIKIVEGREPTCTETGLTSGKICTLCGETVEQQTEIPKSEHSFSNWATVEASTISQHGKAERTCRVCSYSEQKELALKQANITLFLYDDEDLIELTKKQINVFLELHPEYSNFDVQIAGGESYGMTPPYFDNSGFIDLYFSELWYSLDRFMEIDALSPISGEYLEWMEKSFDSEMLDKLSKDGSVYGYPLMTSPTLCTYYDKSIITDPESLEQMIADVEAYNEAHPDSPKYICFNHKDSSYATSFLLALDENGEHLCYIEYDADSDGNFIGYRDNINSENGLIAMKGMEKLLKSSCHSDDTDILENAAVIITDKMLKEELASLMGDNLAFADLPSFTVEGKTYHMSSMSKMAFMGIKPQEDPHRQKFLFELAQYLSGVECQAQRLEELGWFPTNLDALEDEMLREDALFNASLLQREFSFVQGAIHGSWWDIVKVLSWDAKDAQNDDDMYESLKTYEAAMKALFIPSCGGGTYIRWSVIGNISGSKWDKDFIMTEVSKGVWESEPLEFEIGSNFKLRYLSSWDRQIGAGGRFRTDDYEPQNIVSEVEGTFIIRMEWDGVSDTATITFIPVEE